MVPVRGALTRVNADALPSNGQGWGVAVGAVVAETAAGYGHVAAYNYRGASLAEGIKSFLISFRRLPWMILFCLLLYIGVDKFALTEMLDAAAHEHGGPQRAVESVGATGDVLNRQLSGSSSEGHKHDVLLFLFNAIIVGIVVTQARHLSFFRGLQQTVVTFVLGMLYSLSMEGLHRLGVAEKDLGMLGRSYEMWMHIDPHMLLFTMLPALLAGDAMNIDTSIVRRVASQCILLAGPGVVVNGMSIALFLWWYLPYDWSFLLSLTTGAILCATDPVATVALLKELGASPTITVQIQGESLLNDGTAIVLYTLSYNMLKGETYDSSQVIIFLVRTAMCAWLLGVLIGWLFFFWISAANNKFDHHAGILQIALSLCCAYWSFIIAEGVLKMSGVLATVAASLVLADKMWHVLVSKESMHTVWEMVEYLGNTLIFFLAGALFGKSTVRVQWQDMGHLLVIYVFVTVIRFAILMLFRPLLSVLAKKYKQDVTVADVLVMTWGGLRGAVGLALAIQVNVERAGSMSEADAHRVLFYVGGVAALSLMINATTCPLLVKWLGLSQLPETKQRMLFRIHDQLGRILQRGLKKNPDLRLLSSMFEGVLDEVGERLLSSEIRTSYRETALGWKSRVGSSQRPPSVFRSPLASNVASTNLRGSANVETSEINTESLSAEEPGINDPFLGKMPLQASLASKSYDPLWESTRSSVGAASVGSVAGRSGSKPKPTFSAVESDDSDGSDGSNRRRPPEISVEADFPEVDEEEHEDVPASHISVNGLRVSARARTEPAVTVNGNHPIHSASKFGSTPTPKSLRFNDSVDDLDGNTFQEMKSERSTGSEKVITPSKSKVGFRKPAATCPRLSADSEKTSKSRSQIMDGCYTSPSNCDIRDLRRQKLWGPRLTRAGRSASRKMSRISAAPGAVLTRATSNKLSMISAFSLRSTVQPAEYDSETASRALRRANGLSAVTGLTGSEANNNNAHVIDMLSEEREAFNRIHERDVELLGDVGGLPSYEEELKLIQLVMSSPEEPLLLRAINEAFLSLVKAQYWEQIQEGQIVSGTHEAGILLSSVKLALSQEVVDLCDFRFIKPYVERPLNALSSLEPLQRHSVIERHKTKESISPVSTTVSAFSMKNNSARNRVSALVESTRFQLIIMLAVIANAIFIGIEELKVERDEISKRESSIGWLLADAVFTLIFTVEFLLMFVHLKCRYFLFGWNLFDFGLVILGLFGLVLNILVEANTMKDTAPSEQTDVTSEGRLVRIARVFRVLRLLRLFRLFRFWQVIKAKLMQRQLSLETAEHIQKITMLLCFVRAHMRSRKLLVQFFGICHEVDSVEIANCILQSQVETYKALCMAVAEQQLLDGAMLLEKEHYNRLKETAENLESFITSAHEGGVLTANDADAILHPLHNVLKKCHAYIKNSHFGLTSKRIAQEAKHQNGHRLTLGGSQEWMDSSSCLSSDCDKDIVTDDLRCFQLTAAAIPDITEAETEAKTFGNESTSSHTWVTVTSFDPSPRFRRDSQDSKQDRACVPGDKMNRGSDSTAASITPIDTSQSDNVSEIGIR